MANKRSQITMYKLNYFYILLFNSLFPFSLTLFFDEIVNYQNNTRVTNNIIEAMKYHFTPNLTSFLAFDMEMNNIIQPIIPLLNYVVISNASYEKKNSINGEIIPNNYLILKSNFENEMDFFGVKRWNIMSNIILYFHTRNDSFCSFNYFSNKSFYDSSLFHNYRSVLIFGDNAMLCHSSSYLWVFDHWRTQGAVYSLKPKQLNKVYFNRKKINLKRQSLNIVTSVHHKRNIYAKELAIQNYLIENWNCIRNDTHLKYFIYMQTEPLYSYTDNPFNVHEIASVIFVVRKEGQWPSWQVISHYYS